MEYLLDGSKEYTCSIQMGVATDTYDAMGEIVDEKDSSFVRVQQVESAVREFRGEIAQVPPIYSALKRQGRRLYELAREGVEVELEARPVLVHDIQLTDWDPPVATVDVVCGKGFYVRSLAHDLGNVLGCGGHLKSLVRRRTGPFSLDDAVSLDEAVECIVAGCSDELLYSPDVVLESMPAMVLGQQNLKMVRNGRPMPAGQAPGNAGPDARVRAYSTDGSFVAVMRFDGELSQWRPYKVFDV